MKILLTGATGFVGSHLAAELVSRGHQVFALVRATSSSDFLKKLGIQLILGDLDSPPSSSVILPECDAVIHVGGIIKAKTIHDFYRINAEGTRWLCEQLRYQEIKKLVYVSSIAARGPNLNSETEKGKGPVSHYGKSKVKGEEIVLEYGKRFPVCLVRPPIVYGPRDRETLTLFKFFRRGFFPLIGKIPLKTSFIHVTDLSKMLTAMAENDSCPSAGSYYPDDGKGGYTSEEVLKIAGEVFGRRIKTVKVPLSLVRVASGISELIMNDVLGRPPLLNNDKFKEMREPFWFCSQSALKDAFKISSAIRLRRGLEETKKWYEKEGWL